MSVTRSMKNSLDWRYHFGKRYLSVGDFIRFCEVVGLHGCSEDELEYYEQERWMFPVARTVAPEEYARARWEALYGPKTEFKYEEKYLPFYRLDMAIRHPSRWQQDPASSDPRHPIDQAWDHVEQLERPAEKDFQPWDSYAILVTSGELEIREVTASHFYHYWQAYELFHVRKLQVKMYDDNVPLRMPPGQTYADLPVVYFFLDAVSYFQDLYQLRRLQLLSTLSPDDSGWIVLDQAQQKELEVAARRHAEHTLAVYRLEEDQAYAGLRGMMYLHKSYEESERTRLAEALKEDIWRAVQFMYHAFGRDDTEIAKQAGRVWGHSQNYLEVLFPNQRKETQARATRLLVSLAEEHNKRALNYVMSDSEIQDLVSYIESSDLSWLEYVIVGLNDSYFAHHSWQVAESFMHLKTFASFPEALAKTLILRNGDPKSQNDLLNERNPGMAAAANLVFRQSGTSVLAQRDSAGAYSARNVAEFTRSLSCLVKLVASASTDDEYVGSSLALATLVRNFTSHLVVEDPNLFDDQQYVQCVRAIVTTAYAIWKVAKAKSWV